MNVCRICSGVIGETNFFRLSKSVQYSGAQCIKNMLEKVVPELKTTTKPDDLLCLSCWFLLEQLYNFKTTCLQNETKVMQYIQNCATNALRPIDLHKVVKFYDNVCYKNRHNTKEKSTKSRQLKVSDVIGNDEFVIHPSGLIEQIVSINTEPTNRKIPKQHHNKSTDTSLSQGDCNCSSCGKMFKKTINLSKHVAKCRGIMDHTCQICSKTFQNAPHLKRHLLLHTGEKTHTCELCHKMFAEKGGLRRHLLTHSDDKPYKCEICDKGFTQGEHLRTHVQTHTGEKKFQCEICQKDFRHRNSFKTHMRTHTGEKPYWCEICNKAFNDGSCYRRHLQRRTHCNRC